MKSRILTALEPEQESSLVARLGGLRDVDLVRRCPDLADLVAASAAGLADVAIVSASLRGLDRDALAQVRADGVQIVGLSVTEHDERRLRQFGIAQIVAADCTTEELDRALRAHVRPAVPADPEAGWAALEAGLDPREAELALTPPADVADDNGEGVNVGSGRIVAIWGPTGSPGRTTIATNLAAELTLQGHTVLLIDADTYAASVGQHLGLLDEAPGIAAAARAAELGTLDLPVLARLAPTVDPGFRVLTGLPSAARWPEVRADSLSHTLTLARSLVDITVIDCGFCLEDDEDLSYDTRAPRRNAATLTALTAADDIIAVGSGDPVGLQRLVRALADLEAAVGTAPTVIVNRVRSSVAGMSPERAVAETLERFASVRVDHIVPDDRAALDRALLAGRLLHDVAPKSPARNRIRTIANELAKAPVNEALSAPVRFDLRRGFRRWSTA